MSHLIPETLARLVDEPPTAAEAMHLETCTACRRELDGLITQTAALGDLPDLLPPPPGAWTALEARLRREGLIRARPWPRTLGTAFPRIAATIAVFFLGGIAGFAARGRIDAPGTAVLDAAAPSLPSIRPANEVDDAARVLADAETAYRDALARYAELAGAEAGADPIARLAALDDIVLTTREALSEAPADPVINGYHLTALAQREATMKQLVLASNTWY